MKKVDKTSRITGWIFGLIVFSIGVLNMILVHPVPGLIYLLLSFVYFPPVNNILRKIGGFTIPPVLKIILGIFITWFTLGISDLGDMID
jgi:hypothetical protein